MAGNSALASRAASSSAQMVERPRYQEYAPTTYQEYISTRYQECVTTRYQQRVNKCDQTLFVGAGIAAVP